MAATNRRHFPRKKRAGLIQVFVAPGRDQHPIGHGDAIPVKIINQSDDGFYIETELSSMPKTGQKVKIALRLPSERNVITLKAQVVYENSEGFGCKLCDPTPETLGILERCFDIFSGTLAVSQSPEASCHISNVI